MLNHSVVPILKSCKDISQPSSLVPQWLPFSVHALCCQAGMKGEVAQMCVQRHPELASVHSLSILRHLSLCL